MQDTAASRFFCPICRTSYDDSGILFCQHDGARLRATGEQPVKWVGQTVADKYRIVELLGSGGAAEVYRAEHVHLGREVAVKLLRPRLAADPVMMERFKQEARLVSLIAHANVVSVDDFGALPDGTLYMVMELLRGRTAAEAMERGLVDAALAMDVVIQACRGLAVAHDRNVVHRDIKPSNLFLHRPQGPDERVGMVVKLLDLGTAKLYGQETSNLTVTGSIFGTPEYMAPEQALGGPVGPAADVYSLGITLYELLLDRVPFTSPSFMAVLTKHLTEVVPWPRELAEGRGVPPAAEAIVLKALSKNPDHRFQSTREFELALAELRDGMVPTPSLPATEPPPRVAEYARRPSSFPRVSLTFTQGSGAEVVEIAPDVYWVGRRQGSLLECNTYLRVFRGAGTELALLVDPGPPRDLEMIAAKVGAVIGSLDRVDLVFLNHQDPDLAGNAAVIQALNPQAHVLCSEDTWRLVQFYGLNPKSHSATEHFRGGETELATGHSLEFVPTPYCHFRGAVALYDRAAGVLFSGDLFGGVSRSPRLLAAEHDWPDVELFHQLYMPSHKALAHAVAHIRRLTPKPTIIAPQHGVIVAGERVDAWLERVARLSFGADLLVDEDEKGRYLAVVRALLDWLVRLLGPDTATEVVWRYGKDGSFPNLFTFRDTLEVVDFKIEPRAALRALERDALAFVPSSQVSELGRVMDDALGRHGLTRHYRAPAD
jgi:serine/threonine protein kinase/glyoxylase-like metal-dependent hydrolase (beta-lactamase superfamily II)